MINLELSSLHKSIGGKMVDYAGFNMAVQYEGVISEHLAVRNYVGVFEKHGHIDVDIHCSLCFVYLKLLRARGRPCGLSMFSENHLWICWTWPNLKITPYSTLYIYSILHNL